MSPAVRSAGRGRLAFGCSGVRSGSRETSGAPPPEVWRLPLPSTANRSKPRRSPLRLLLLAAFLFLFAFRLVLGLFFLLLPLFFRGFLFLRRRLLALQQDVPDLDLDVILAVTPQPAVILAPPEMLDVELGRGKIQHVRQDAGALDQRPADLRI